MEEHALIFNIQRYSLHDGPGIRTLVFFKGCPMRCKWCSNPEGMCAENQVKFLRTACTGCGTCLKVCPANAIVWDNTAGIKGDAASCIQCGACISACPTRARSWWGDEFGAEELYAKATRDKSFFSATGGGVTLGGGDPLMQHKFALSFLRRCRSGGINTAVETEAFCTFDVLSLCAGLCDTLFTDVKAWQPSVHRELTGVDNSVVLGNLSALSEWMASAPSKPAWIIRLPFLPGVNFFKEDMKPLAGYLRSLGDCLSGVEILPFHNFGEHKYAQTGLPYSFLGEPNLRGEAVEAYAEELRGEGVPVTVTQW